MATLFPINNPSTAPGVPSTALASGNRNVNNYQQFDLFELVVEAQINGTPFPCLHFDEAGSQTLVQHLYPNLDVARVEPTGRNSSVFSCTALLINNIDPQDNETWIKGTLYPDTFNILLGYCYQNKKPLTLQHPVLGLKNVYIQSWHHDVVGTIRDGVYLNMTFLETLVDNNLANDIAAPHKVGALNNIANNIADDLNNLTPQIKMPGLSLNQFLSSVAGSISNAVNYPNQFIEALNGQILDLNGLVTQFGKILPNATTALAGNLYALSTTFAQVVQNAKSLALQNQDALEFVPVTNAYDYVQTQLTGPTFVAVQPIPQMEALFQATWNLNYNPSQNAAQLIENTISFTNAMINYYQAFNRVETAQLVEHLYQFLNQLFTILNNLPNNNPNGWRVKTYIVPRSTTIINLAHKLNQTVDNLLLLNPNMHGAYLVKEASIISYFQS